jgi:hypothetical protein
MDNESLSQDQDILDILRGLESTKAEYPPELLAERRRLFIEQLEKHAQLEAVSELAEKDQRLTDIFRSLKALEPEYPPQELAIRRSLYQRQVFETVQDSVWYALRSTIRNIVAGWVSSQRSSSLKFRRAFVMAAGIGLMALATAALYGKVIQSSSPILTQNEIFTATPGQVSSAAQAEIVCKEGSQPPLCIALQLDPSQNVAYTGNGQARPAVAKDTMQVDGQMNSPAYINDGLYGPGARWVSNSPNSWIKIDLGTSTLINTIAFAPDPLGRLHDGNPGRFIIALAAADNVYANGDSRNDEREYVQVYDSQQAGFDGTISGADTIVALFDLRRARFIKITFENARTAIDEVEAFVSSAALAAIVPTNAPSGRDESPHAPLPPPASTLIPTDTATAVPIDTLPPTETFTPAETATPVPTDTVTPMETATPVNTETPAYSTVSPLGETPFPPPIYTPIFLPTDEPIPAHGQ